MKKHHNFNPRSCEGSDWSYSTIPRKIKHFNPRSREGSDGGARLHRERRRYFNPRSREGSDKNRFQFCNGFNIFQSTLPRRERRQRCYSDNGSNHFNPRSREGSDRSHLLSRQKCSSFQSTLPRRERPAEPQVKNAACDISIHAPAKGATQESSPLHYITNISIHAPAKGATIAESMRFLPEQHFNPRSREGSDRLHAGFHSRSQVISIHAPVKGATPRHGCARPDGQISIHAPVKGATKRSAV